VNFGQDPVGTQSSPQTLTLTNSGTTAITVNTVQANGPFVASGFASTTTLSPSQSQTLSVTFTPVAPGLASGALAVTSSATNSPLSISLSGIGEGAVASVKPISLNFGNQTVGVASGNQPVTLSNTGQLNLFLNQVSVSPSVFTMSGPTPPMTIIPGSSVTYNVAFNPSAPQGYAGSLTFTSNAYNGTVMTSVSGTGVTATTVLNVNPTTLSFGNQIVNTTSGAQAVTLSNGGSTAITINNVQAAAPFAVSGFSGVTTLSAGQSLPLTVTFTPTIQTAYNGTLTISYNSTSSATVTLSGTGIVQTSGTPCGALNDTAIHTPPNYTTFVPPPGVGSSYTDPQFGCTVQRITANPLNGNRLVHYYSSTDAFNSNDTYLVVESNNGQFGVLDLQGNTIVDALTHGIGGSSSTPIWDHTNPNKMWVTSGNSLQYCTIANPGPSGTCSPKTTVHTWSGFTTVLIGWKLGNLEGNGLSDDGDHILISGFKSGSATNSFVYTISTDSSSAGIGITGSPDWVDITHDNNIIINWGNTNDSTYGICHSGSYVGQTCPGPPYGSGLEIFAPSGTFLHQAAYWGAHSTRYSDGTHSFVGMYEVRGDTGNFPNCAPGVIQFDTNKDYPNNWTCMLNMHPYASVLEANGSTHRAYNCGCHISGSTTGWVEVSFEYGDIASYPFPPAAYPAYWNMPYINEVLVINADGSKVYRLAHTRSSEADYWKTQRASMSHDGKYVVFSGDYFANSLTSWADEWLIKVQ
jgi:hypothetical protein